MQLQIRPAGQHNQITDSNLADQGQGENDYFSRVAV